jgi:hypothetical protein
VTVGGSIGTTTFYVHRNLLISNSRYFQHALDHTWRTDATKPILLLDTRPVHFGMYAQWLYSKQLPTFCDAEAYNLLAGLYILGERIIDKAFQEVVLSATTRAAQPCLATARIIYNNTIETSPARSVVLERAAGSIQTGAWQRGNWIQIPMAR